MEAEDSTVPAKAEVRSTAAEESNEVNAPVEETEAPPGEAHKANRPTNLTKGKVPPGETSATPKVNRSTTLV